MGRTVKPQASSREPAELTPGGCPGPGGALARSGERRTTFSLSARSSGRLSPSPSLVPNHNRDERVDDLLVGASPGSAADCWRSGARGPVQHLWEYRQQSAASKQAAEVTAAGRRPWRRASQPLARQFDRASHARAPTPQTRSARLACGAFTLYPELSRGRAFRSTSYLLGRAPRALARPCRDRAP